MFLILSFYLKPPLLIFLGMPPPKKTTLRERGSRGEQEFYQHVTLIWPSPLTPRSPGGLEGCSAVPSSNPCDRQQSDRLGQGPTGGQGKV